MKDLTTLKTYIIDTKNPKGKKTVFIDKQSTKNSNKINFSKPSGFKSPSNFKRGLSQKELATKLCVQPNIIQQWEAGKSVVPGNCVSALNKALKVNIKKQEFLD